MKRTVSLTLAAALLLGINCINVLAYDGNDEEGRVDITLPQMVSSTLSDKVSASVITERVSYSNKYAAVNINKPVVTMENKDVQDKINKKISGVINKYEEGVVSQSKEDNKFNEENGLDVKQYVVNVNSSTAYNRNGILSVVLRFYSYTGGAHGMNETVPLNFDLNTGNAGVLYDFFGNNKDYKEIILKAIKDKTAENPEMYFQEELTKYKDVPYNQKFYLTDDNAVIVFDEYQIAPFAAGTVEFQIPYSAFPEGINKNIDIKEEAAFIDSDVIKSRGRINTYLSYPNIKNLGSEDSEAMINDYLRSEIDDYITDVVKKNIEGQYEGLKGITTFFKAAYKDRNTMSLSITYSALDDKDSQIILQTKTYTIDLDGGKITAD